MIEPHPRVDDLTADPGLTEWLEEEREKLREAKTLFSIVSSGAAWSVPLLLSFVTAAQFLIAADFSPVGAAHISAVVDKGKALFASAILAVQVLTGVAPLYCVAYFRGQLALRYAYLAITKLQGSTEDLPLLDKRLHRIKLATSVSVGICALFSPWPVTALVFVIVTGSYLSGARSVFAPKRIWERLREQGLDGLPPTQLARIIDARVEASNLRRYTLAGWGCVAVAASAMYSTPGYFYATQRIEKDDGSVIIGAIIGSSPQGAVILVDHPRHVTFLRDERIKSAEYCTSESTVRSSSTVTLLFMPERRWSYPDC